MIFPVVLHLLAPRSLIEELAKSPAGRGLIALLRPKGRLWAAGTAGFICAGQITAFPYRVAIGTAGLGARMWSAGFISGVQVME